MSGKDKFRILIVEDVHSTAVSIREALIRDGFSEKDITECYQLEDAKKILKKTVDKPSEKFDVITIDLYMDGDLWAGIKLCGFIEKKIRPQYGQSISGVIYSRYANYIKEWDEGVEERLKRELNHYKRTGVIQTVLPKSKDHEGLRKFVKQLYDSKLQETETEVVK